MTIDDLIEELQKMKRLHGDCEVAINNKDECGEDNWEVIAFSWHSSKEILEIW